MAKGHRFDIAIPGFPRSPACPRIWLGRMSSPLISSTCRQTEPSSVVSAKMIEAREKNISRTVAEYRRSFSIVPATTEALREQVFRLRYQVYCVENQWEDPAQHSDEIEIDVYDAHSVQSLLIHRASGTAIGAVRLILPLDEMPEKSFPIQGVCRAPQLGNSTWFPLSSGGEVSRFCISKEFRKRREDMFHRADQDRSSTGNERRVIPHLTLALIEALVLMSIENRVSHWFAMIEPSLMRLLARLGIHFDPIGQMIDYHGLRQPCCIRLDRLVERVCAENQHTWDILTDHGDRWDAIRFLPSPRD
ncbi:MAG: PEP-CTERM/exosortase system-associated acyltransferase [Gammaproteobacteria bacterium]|nr:PEP-CTERM/exosortase system-associated acyltransferase [Gammaproteobacteria bacterium]